MENDIEQPLLQEHNTEENLLNSNINLNEYNQYHARTCWQNLSFNWISPLLRLGFTLPQLQQHHLPHLPPQAASDVCGEALWKAWEREIDAAIVKNRSPSLLRALFQPFGWSFLALGGFKFINDALNFAGPVLLNGLLRYLDASSSKEGQRGAAAAPAALLVVPPIPPTTLFNLLFHWPMHPQLLPSSRPESLFPKIHSTTTKYQLLDPASDIFGAGCAALLALTFFFKVKNTI
jgi:hypothetical protein